MYARILAAIDGSRTSHIALDHAIALAKQAGARLRIVHVVDEVSFNWDSSFANPAAVWQSAAATGDALLQSALEAAAAAGVASDCKLVEMDRVGRKVPELIAREADAWNADLIVVGTHGRRGLTHVVLGSVAEGVVRAASKPVLLIRGA